MQKLKKSIDFLKITFVAKISRRSKKFSKLADFNNICVVYNNESSFKKLFVRTKIS